MAVTTTPGVEVVTLEGFRLFRTLSVRGLGRVNLITGKNNTGKSSLLEGLRILATGAAIDVLQDIVRHREEHVTTAASGLVARSEFLFSGLFHGFPELSDELAPMSISSANGGNGAKITAHVSWFSEELDRGGNLNFTERTPDDPEGAPYLVVTTDGGIRFHRLGDRSTSVELHRQGATARGRGCLFVGPYSGAGTDELGKLWDGVAISDDEQVVVEALQVIDPHISKVAMVGGESPRGRRTAIVRADNIARPVPLRSFGDGMNRLFSIILSLVNCRDTIMLIDEFENGLHHTVQLDAWRIVFRLARSLDVQVFATTHSWDTIRAFQQAAREVTDTGVLIRLTRRGKDIVPTVFPEHEVAIAARERIEVR